MKQNEKVTRAGDYNVFKAYTQLFLHYQTRLQILLSCAQTLVTISWHLSLEVPTSDETVPWIVDVWPPLMLREAAWGEKRDLIGRGRNAVRALFLRTLSMLFIYLLSNPKRVNQKPQWGEGRGEMDIDVKWRRIYFLLLCIGLSCFHASVCFMGLLIKIARLLCDMEGCVGGAVCLIDCAVGGSELPSVFIQYVRPQSVSSVAWNVYFHSLASFWSFFFWYRFAHKRSRDTSVSNSPGVLTKTSIHN